MKAQRNTRAKAIRRAATWGEKIALAQGESISIQERVADRLASRAWSLRKAQTAEERRIAGRESFDRDVGRLLSEVLVQDDTNALLVLIKAMERHRRIVRAKKTRKPDRLRLALLVFFPDKPAINLCTGKVVDRTPRNWKELSAKLDAWQIKYSEQSAVYRLMRDLGVWFPADK